MFSLDDMKRINDDAAAAEYRAKHPTGIPSPTDGCQYCRDVHAVEECPSLALARLAVRENHKWRSN